MSSIEMINKVPDFIRFFEKAEGNNADEAKRWQLWQQYYNFSGMPPGFEAEERKQLAEVWKDYQEYYETLKDFTPDTGRIENYVGETKSILGVEKDVPFAVLFFVGGFDGNAAVVPYGEQKALLILPIETPIADITIAHELTHIIHTAKAEIPIRWEAPLAERVMMEGLAMHTSKALVPGRDDTEYIEMGSDGWLESCRNHHNAIISGIIPYLDDTHGGTNARFTYGEGTTGHKREVYYAGWAFIASELEKGVSLEELASIQKDDVPDYVKRHIEDTLI
ncbi:MAG TPA: hypothetical protein H9994_04205 [Candidatus Salinicoccus merdavium]|nr:hypothetical protein [Candidatus Salinicoccus merdavium]